MKIVSLKTETFVVQLPNKKKDLGLEKQRIKASLRVSQIDQSKYYS